MMQITGANLPKDYPMSPPRKFDIFAGEIQKNAIWLEAVAGLDEAKKRMEQTARQKPGHYFIFCSATSSVVAELESHLKLVHKPKSTGHSVVTSSKRSRRDPLQNKLSG